MHAVGGPGASCSRPSVGRLKMKKRLVDVFPSFACVGALNHQASNRLLLAVVVVEIGESLSQTVRERDPANTIAAWPARRDSSPGLRASFLCVNE